MAKKEEKMKKEIGRRDFLKLVGTGGAALGAGAVLAACAQETPAPAATKAPVEEPKATEAVEVGTPLKGTKIRAMLNDFPFQHYVVSKLDEFTKQTGIEIEQEMVAWPVLLEQTEIELSSGSDNYDVLIQIFIKAQRFMRAGWSAPLDDLIASTGFDLDDFISSTRNAMNWEGVQYGIPFLAESTQMIYRSDVLSEAGLEPPQDFDELAAVLEATHNPPDFYSYVMRTEPNGVHFPFPIWLQGFGGNIFRDPPNDLTPTLNTPEAIEAATNFTDLVLKYSIAGSQTYATPDCQNAMAQGQAGIWVDALGIFPPVRDPEQSTVADKTEITLVPGGPAGRFPQIASHGYQIPKNSKNKEAAWEFIRWACSEEMMLGSAIEGGYFAHARKSVLTSPEYSEVYDKGDTKIGELIAEAVNLAKVEYRVVPEFPEVGKRLGQGIGEIISGQKSVQEAMDSVQADVEQIMISSGHEIDT
jgi:multiple sugar transport system substrate-binding protein